MDLYLSIGDEEGAVRARQALVLGAFLGGDPEAARSLESENLEAFRRSGSWYRVADSLTLLSAVAIDAGDADGAARYIHEALAIVGARGMATPIVGGLGVAALIALAREDPETAARLAGASAALAERSETANAMIEVLHMPDPVEAVRQRLGPAAEPLLAEGGALSVEEAVALASR